MREFSEKELEEKYKDLKMQDIPDMWEDIERNLAPKKVKSKNAESKNTESKNAESKNVESKKVESKNVESKRMKKAADNKKTVRSRRKKIPIGRIASIAAVLTVLFLAVPVWNMIRQGVDGTLKSSDCAVGETAEGFYEMENTTASTEDFFIDESVVDESTENFFVDESAVDDSTENSFVDGSAVDDSIENPFIDESAAANTEGASEEESVRNDTDDRESGTTQEALQSRQLTISVQILEVQEMEAGFVIRTELLGDVEGHKAGDILDISCDMGETAEFTGEMQLLVEETEENLKLLQILP